MGQTTIETLQLTEQTVDYCDDCGITDVELFPAAINPAVHGPGQLRADYTGDLCRTCAETLVGSSIGPPTDDEIVELDRSDRITISRVTGTIYAFVPLELIAIAIGTAFLIAGGVVVGLVVTTVDVNTADGAQVLLFAAVLFAIGIVLVAFSFSDSHDRATELRRIQENGWR